MSWPWPSWPSCAPASSTQNNASVRHNFTNKFTAPLLLKRARSQANKLFEAGPVPQSAPGNNRRVGDAWANTPPRRPAMQYAVPKNHLEGRGTLEAEPRRTPEAEPQKAKKAEVQSPAERQKILESSFTLRTSASAAMSASAKSQSRCPTGI